MTTDDLNRKLTAIISADVAGYSRLMAEDEVETVQRLKSYRKLIGVRVREHHGRVVDSPGDNLLAEFPSALDAVRSAVEIQRVLKTRNDDLPNDHRMQFRIGIHLGDVMVDGDRIYGDGVNIAARLEGLADPGGTCISGMVHNQVKNKLDLNVVSIGDQEIKNIPDPIPAYKILSFANAPSNINGKSGGISQKTYRKLFAVLGILILLGIGFISVRYNFLHTKSTPEPTSVSETASVSIEKPSIAVLPFENMSGDPEQEYFSDGMSEEIINGLAKNPGLIVKGRTSSFSEKIRNQDIKTIAELLNVTHIVEGSVRKSGDRIRITAQLIDTSKDAHIWSNKYDRELTDVFEIQDEISAEILRALNIHLMGSYKKQIRTRNMEAYDAFLLGYYHYNRRQFEKAEKSMKKAISLDSDYADAYGALARIYNVYAWGFNHPAKNYLFQSRNYINSALSKNPDQPDALAIKSFLTYIFKRKYQDAIDEFAKLTNKYPHNHTVLALYKNLFIKIGKGDIALRIADRMVELEPLNVKSHRDRGILLMLFGRYDEARESFKRVEAMERSEAADLARFAFAEGDLEGLQKQLDLGKSAWDPLVSHLYTVYEAGASYLKGDQERIKEILAPLWQTTDYVSCTVKSYMAALEGNLALSLDHYSHAVSESEYFAMNAIQKPEIISQIFPDYRSHPTYRKMLKDVGLDMESITKLKIPPLPF